MENLNLQKMYGEEKSKTFLLLGITIVKNEQHKMHDMTQYIGARAS
jgi:hypothetical protein